MGVNRHFQWFLFRYVTTRLNIKMREFVIPLTGLTTPRVCACPKPGPGFPTSYIVVLYMFSNLRWKVFVHFVHIGGIVVHQCFIFIFRINVEWKPGSKDIAHWLMKIPAICRCLPILTLEVGFDARAYISGVRFVDRSRWPLTTQQHRYPAPQTPHNAWS